MGLIPVGPDTGAGCVNCLLKRHAVQRLVEREGVSERESE